MKCITRDMCTGSEAERIGRTKLSTSVDRMYRRLDELEAETSGHE
jgi:hypothetical protein